MGCRFIYRGQDSCSAATLYEWVKKTEVDSGKRAGLPSDVAEKMKALERENRELRQATTRYCARRLLISPRRSSTAPSNDDLVHRRTPWRVRGRADLQAFADCPVNLLRETLPSAWTWIACRCAPRSDIGLKIEIRRVFNE